MVFGIHMRDAFMHEGDLLGGKGGRGGCISGGRYVFGSHKWLHLKDPACNVSPLQ